MFFAEDIRMGSSRRKVLFVFGTRPEAIKLAPVVLAMKSAGGFSPRICVTAQHREMLDQMTGLFRLRPHHDLNIMKKGQDLFDITSRGLSMMKAVIEKDRPGMVVVQGDTTSTFIGALAAFYTRTPVGHVEAGLRTGLRYEPYPEEMNRSLTTRLSDLHFAPTTKAREALLREGVSRASIFVTGNTTVDALLYVRNKVQGRKKSAYERMFPFLDTTRPMVLVTAHRRESFGRGLRNICEAIRNIVKERPELQVVYPVHLNPSVRSTVLGLLKGVEGVHLIEPQGYEPFVYLMMRSYLILTDSGGIQEEAPSLSKPVLVMRDVTERGEAVNAGACRLVGTGKKGIVDEVMRLLEDKAAYKKMARSRNPYGDGRASERIVNEIGAFLGNARRG